MAKMRDDIALVCDKCNRRNYMTNRDLKKEGKLHIKKYCKWCHEHVVHSEKKKK
jgi:large subunit ribosomal protein L33